MLKLTAECVEWGEILSPSQIHLGFGNLVLGHFFLNNQKYHDLIISTMIYKVLYVGISQILR